MKARKGQKVPKKEEQPAEKPSLRNRALHIPLDFEKAVEGLLNTKPKKKPPKK